MLVSNGREGERLLDSSLGGEFSFQGRGDTGRGFAELGPERNGVFL